MHRTSCFYFIFAGRSIIPLLSVDSDNSKFSCSFFDASPYRRGANVWNKAKSSYLLLEGSKNHAEYFVILMIVSLRTLSMKIFAKLCVKILKGINKKNRCSMTLTFIYIFKARLKSAMINVNGKYREL